MNYLAYPKKKDTPSRKSRKGSRQKVYWTNHTLGRVARKARRDARRAELEAQSEE
jgi:hypothetical protein